MIVTILILLGLSASFIFGVIIPKASEPAFKNFYEAKGFHFLISAYSMMILLSFWAMVMTYKVGPGFVEDHFKAVKKDSQEKNDEATFLIYAKRDWDAM